METTIVYWGYIGIMEKKMETTIVYWGYIGIMEKKMETTIVYYVCKVAPTTPPKSTKLIARGGFEGIAWIAPKR